MKVIPKILEIVSKTWIKLLSESERISILSSRENRDYKVFVWVCIGVVPQSNVGVFRVELQTREFVMVT